MSKEEEVVECPLCLEHFDETDKAFSPCSCGYRICLWCWHDVNEKVNGKCPACRAEYNREQSKQQLDNAHLIKKNSLKNIDRKSTASLAPLTGAEIATAALANYRATGKVTSSTSRDELSGIRVLQRNLLYVVGLPYASAKEDILMKREYLGRFGKIIKVAINKKCISIGTSLVSFSAYVTFKNASDAKDAIQAINGATIDGRTVRATFGTTKYCSFFLSRGLQCNNHQCLYLHALANPDDSFTKDELAASDRFSPEFVGTQTGPLISLPLTDSEYQQYKNEHSNANPTPTATAPPTAITPKPLTQIKSAWGSIAKATPAPIIPPVDVANDTVTSVETNVAFPSLGSLSSNTPTTTAPLGYASVVASNTPLETTKSTSEVVTVKAVSKPTIPLSKPEPVVTTSKPKTIAIRPSPVVTSASLLTSTDVKNDSEDQNKAKLSKHVTQPEIQEPTVETISKTELTTFEKPVSLTEKAPPGLSTPALAGPPGMAAPGLGDISGPPGLTELAGPPGMVPTTTPLSTTTPALPFGVTMETTLSSSISNTGISPLNSSNIASTSNTATPIDIYGSNAGSAFTGMNGVNPGYNNTGVGSWTSTNEQSMFGGLNLQQNSLALAFNSSFNSSFNGNIHNNLNHGLGGLNSYNSNFEMPSYNTSNNTSEFSKNEFPFSLNNMYSSHNNTPLVPLNSLSANSLSNLPSNSNTTSIVNSPVSAPNNQSNESDYQHSNPSHLVPDDIETLLSGISISNNNSQFDFNPHVPHNHVDPLQHNAKTNVDITSWAEDLLANNESNNFDGINSNNEDNLDTNESTDNDHYNHWDRHQMDPRHVPQPYPPHFHPHPHAPRWSGMENHNSNMPPGMNMPPSRIQHPHGIPNHPFPDNTYYGNSGSMFAHHPYNNYHNRSFNHEPNNNGYPEYHHVQPQWHYNNFPGPHHSHLNPHPSHHPYEYNNNNHNDMRNEMHNNMMNMNNPGWDNHHNHHTHPHYNHPHMMGGNMGGNGWNPQHRH